MNKDSAIRQIFKLRSESFVLQPEIEKGFRELDQIFRPKLGNPEVKRAWDKISWARKLFQNNANCVAYARDGWAGLKKRSRDNAFWADLDEIQEVIAMLENEQAFDGQDSVWADDVLPEDFEGPAPEEPAAPAEPDAPAQPAVVAAPVPYAGQHYKTRLRRVLAQKMRRGELMVLIEWATDLPPEWERFSHCAKYFGADLRAALENYKNEEPKKFKFLIKKPEALAAYRG